MSLKKYTAAEATSLSMGGAGFDRITATTVQSADDVWVALKAIGGDATFDSGSTVATGDAPGSGDVIAQGDVVQGRFTAVQFSALTTVYAYRG